MEANELKIFASKMFQEKLEGLQSLYSEKAELVLSVRKGKDDDRGRSLMIHLQGKDQLWCSTKGVAVCLWQNDDETQYKEIVVEKLIDLAVINQMTNITVVESD